MELKIKVVAMDQIIKMVGIQCAITMEGIMVEEVCKEIWLQEDILLEVEE